METQINHSNGTGNWIAFLFGAMFNLIAIRFSDSNSHIAHAVAGAIIFVLFKLSGDFFTPVVHQLGKKLKMG